MADQGLEFPAQRATLDPIDHEPAVAGACGDAVVGVDVVEVLVDVLPAFDEVVVGGSACSSLKFACQPGKKKVGSGCLPQLFWMASVRAWPNPVLPVGLGATTT